MIYPNRKILEGMCLPSLRVELNKILDKADEKLRQKSYDPYWESYKKLDFLDELNSSVQIEERWVKIGKYLKNREETLDKVLFQMKPWRKGPFKWHGIEVEAEWDSDKKWQRLVPFLEPLWGKTVLDVGCNNGYYLTNNFVPEVLSPVMVKVATLFQEILK